MTDSKDARPEPGAAKPAADGQPRHRKLAAHFVDEITNIALSSNGASRIYFATWSMDEQGRPLRIDSELIMTRETIKRLAEVLPGALAQSGKAPDASITESDSAARPGKGLFKSRGH